MASAPATAMTTTPRVLGMETKGIFMGMGRLGWFISLVCIKIAGDTRCGRPTGLSDEDDRPLSFTLSGSRKSSNDAPLTRGETAEGKFPEPRSVQCHDVPALARKHAPD